MVLAQVQVSWCMVWGWGMSSDRRHRLDKWSIWMWKLPRWQDCRRNGFVRLVRRQWEVCMWWWILRTQSREVEWHNNWDQYMKQVARSRHETVNARFKQFGALTKVFRHDLTKPGLSSMPLRSLRSSASCMTSPCLQFTTMIDQSLWIMSKIETWFV